MKRQKEELRKYETDPATSWLSAERVAALEQMGAIFSWSSASLLRAGESEPRAWEESRALLEEHAAAHGGDCNVPARWEDDPQLGRWMHMQKVQWRKYEADPATSSLSAERVAALRQMGALNSWSLAALLRAAARRH